MKKIMYILGILLLFDISVVRALENNIYYSNYGEWSEYSKDNYSKTELMDVEVERRYKWFKNKERGEYLNYDEGIKKYDNLNKDNYKYSDYSNWQEISPEKITDRVIETKVKYFVKRIKPIKTLYIVGGDFKTDEVDLNQIDIFNNGKKVSFKSTCGDCSEKYKLKNKSGVLMLELDNFYYFDNLKIIVKSPNIKNINSINFWATAPKENSNEEALFYRYTFEGSDNSSINISISDFSKVKPIYEDGVYYDELPFLRKDDYKEELVSYRYKDKLYYFFSYDKEYIDGYFKQRDGYEKDENDYIDYYRYRNRDKIEFSEHIEINKNDSFLEEYINSTTEYEIDGNIDYNKNGLYHIKIKTYFITKDVTVSINIKENNKEDIKDKKALEDYKSFEKKYDNLLEEKVENRSSDEVIEEKVEDRSSDEVIEENSCKKELEKVTLKNDDNEKKLKLSNQAYDYLNSSLLKVNNNSFELGLSWYLWLLFLIFLLLIILIMILRKRKNKNKF